jgi:hypothetical protein
MYFCMSESIQYIEDKAFFLCKNIKTIRISSNLKEIGKSVF